MRGSVARNALAALADDERQVIELAYFGGRNVNEIADALNFSHRRIRTLLRSGLAGMRDVLSTRAATFEDRVGTGA